MPDKRLVHVKVVNGHFVSVFAPVEPRAIETFQPIQYDHHIARRSAYQAIELYQDDMQQHKEETQWSL